MAEANNTSEVWKPIPGFEGIYEISNLGRVMALERVVTFTDGRKRKYPKRLRKISVARGYPSIGLTDSTGYSKNYLLHRILAHVFIQPITGEDIVRHLNDIPSDYRLSNLAVGTQQENIDDLMRNGNHFQASKKECKHGHPFDEENTRISKQGGRLCRTCLNARARKYYAMKKKKKVI